MTSFQSMIKVHHQKFPEKEEGLLALLENTLPWWRKVMFQTSQGPLELGVLAGPVQHVLVKELRRERTVWAPYRNM